MLQMLKTLHYKPDQQFGGEENNIQQAILKAQLMQQYCHLAKGM